MGVLQGILPRLPSVKSSIVNTEKLTSKGNTPGSFQQQVGPDYLLDDDFLYIGKNASLASMTSTDCSVRSSSTNVVSHRSSLGASRHINSRSKSKSTGKHVVIDEERNTLALHVNGEFFEYSTVSEI
mmetsp:Transcript_22882/g.53554  ORF Transcript_22882/g.53554 Transcript_22882/m.53554 type:complete len:127 (+) Transcript_22882:115-495(+)